MNAKLVILEVVIRSLLSSRIFAVVIETVLSLIEAHQLPDETSKQFNDRRRRAAIDRIQQQYPEAPTWLLDMAIGLIVKKTKPAEFKVNDG